VFAVGDVQSVILMNETEPSEYKQVILVRIDLRLPPGKLAVQVAHASVDAVLKALKSGQGKEQVRAWHASGSKKVVLRVADKAELFKYKTGADSAGIITALITDAGRTTVPPGTVTALAIGPDSEEKIDEVTGELRMR